MADGKKPSSKKYAFGCGCLLILILMFTCFVLGARYGKEVVDKTIDRVNTITDAVKKGLNDVSEDAGKSVEKIDSEIEKTINR